MQPISITKVDKEQVSNLTFGQNANHERGKRALLKFKLQRALTLGNLYKSHVVLLLCNELGKFFETEATIWAVTDWYVMIKGGTVIPIDSIVDVNM